MARLFSCLNVSLFLYGVTGARFKRFTNKKTPHTVVWRVLMFLRLD